MNNKDEKKTTNEKPVSLAPLDFQEALKGLLQIKPEPKPEKKPRKKRATNKK
jgi:hypothetical protein